MSFFTRRANQLILAQKNKRLLKSWRHLAAERWRENPFYVVPAGRRVRVRGEGQRGGVPPEKVLPGRPGQGERRQGHERRIAT